MDRQKKELLVQDLHEKFKKALAAVVADFQGMDVESMTRFRKSCRESDVDYFVVKNTLTRLAIKDTEFVEMEEHLKGVTSIGLTFDDPVGLAKTVDNFAKEDQNLKVKFGYLAKNRQLLDSKDVKTLASIPSREELLTRLAYVLKSQHTGFVTVLNEVLAKFVRALDAVREKKQASS